MFIHYRNYERERDWRLLNVRNIDGLQSVGVGKRKSALEWEFEPHYVVARVRKWWRSQEDIILEKYPTYLEADRVIEKLIYFISGIDKHEKSVRMIDISLSGIRRKEMKIEVFTMPIPNHRKSSTW